MEFTLYNIFASAITAVGAFASLLLTTAIFSTKKGIQKSNIFLGFIFLIMSLKMLDNFIVYSGLYVKLPHFIFITYPLTYLIDPLFFFYILTYLKPNRNFKWYDVFHLSLFVFIWWTGHLDFVLSPATYKLSVIKHYLGMVYSLKIRAIIIHFVKLIILFGYGVYALRLLKKKKEYFKQNTSINYSQNFYTLFFKYIGITLFSIGLLFLFHFFKMTHAYVELGLFLTNSALLVFLAIWHINKSEALVFTKPKKDKIKRTPKTSSELPDLHTFMLNKKPFLNPELKLIDLATEIDMPARNISIKINNEFGMNFHDFVNYYRVEEFKQMINSNKNEQFTLLGIAFEVGFNSKASFNRVFKNQTGQTPSQFIASKKDSNTVIESTEH